MTPRKIKIPREDYLTRYGSGVLASVIEQHWKSRGYRGIRAERYELPGFTDVFGIRSNIGPAGFPPMSKVRAQPV